MPEYIAINGKVDETQSVYKARGGYGELVS